MDITLYVNNSEVNKIGKNLTNALTLSGTLREQTNVIEPDILITMGNPTEYNYVYIPLFKRYYFIKDITSVRNGLWRLHLTVDTLETYKNEILNCSCILDNTNATGLDNYLTGRNWIAKVKDKTEIKTFPNGLLDTGEFILITAGG
jgi:hypothetical protein